MRVKLIDDSLAQVDHVVPFWPGVASWSLGGKQPFRPFLIPYSCRRDALILSIVEE